MLVAGAVAKLAVVVEAPAIGLVGRGHAAGVRATRADPNELEAARHLRRRAPVGRGAVAQLAVRVAAPAERHTGGGVGAGMILPDSQEAPAPIALHLDRDRAGFDRRPVAELTPGVASPAEDPGVGGEPAGELETGPDFQKAETGGDRRRPGDEVAPAERSIVGRHAAGPPVARADVAERQGHGSSGHVWPAVRSGAVGDPSSSRQPTAAASSAGATRSAVRRMG